VFLEHLFLYRKKLNIFCKSKYFKDSSTNTKGLLLSAVIPLLVIPALSRIYSAQDYGLYATFTAIVGIISGIGAGKYDVAIVMPKTRIHSIEVACVGHLASILSVIFVVVTLILGNIFFSIPSVFLWLIPLAIFISIQFNIALNLAIRDQNFNYISRIRITVATTSAILMLLLGLVGLDFLGLIVATIFAQFIGAAFLISFLSKTYRSDLKKISWYGLTCQMRQYINYPKYSLASDLANSLALKVPILSFATFFGATETGYLAMFERLWSASGIIGKGVGETFRQKAAAEYAYIGNFHKTYLLTFWVLLFFSLPVWVLMIFCGPQIIVFILGESWYVTGIYAQILATLVCMQFLASPLGWSVYIVNKLRWNMVWQVSLLIVYLVVFYIGILLSDERKALIFYSILGSFMYFLYLLISYKLSSGK